MTAVPSFYCSFASPIGACGIAWSEAGVTMVHLPEADAARTEQGLRERLRAAALGPSVPSATARAAIDGILALLGGEPVDLSEVVLDHRGVSDFNRRVYAVARKIGPGQTTTYGALATRIGAPGAARAIGRAMGQNPTPIVVPCHRVLAAGNKTGGFSARGGVTTKLRLLAIEGAIHSTSTHDIEPSPSRGSAQNR